MKQTKVKSRQLNSILIILGSVLTVALLFISYRNYAKYQLLSEVSEHKDYLEENARLMEKGSDDLTNAVRMFVITGKMEYFEAFYEEAEITRTRDNAIDAVQEEIDREESVRRSLEEALRVSNDLVDTEKYAMRLAAEAYGLNINDFHGYLDEVTLSEEDLFMDKDVQARKAIDLVYDDTYLGQKERIYSNIQSAMDTILITSEAQKNQVENEYRSLLITQSVLLFLLLLLMIGFAVIFTRLYVIPLQRFTESLENKDELQEIGSEELRVFARTYNNLLEQIRSDQDELSYEASHDALTQLYNRKIFEKVRLSLENVAMLIIDVDHFKQINDTYGHEVGDATLVKLAKILKVSFRSEDYVCRIGGDEFAVIMLHTDESLSQLIVNKVTHINEYMHNTDDGLPYNSLSIGIAFAGNTEEAESLYSRCDKALYHTKEAGKNGYSFYRESE